MATLPNRLHRPDRPLAGRTLAARSPGRALRQAPARAISWRWPATTTISTLFDSSHHRWNATRVGPRRDMIGGWARARARRPGCSFGVSNHSSHAWHWWQTAYGYDAEGPRAAGATTPSGCAGADGRGKYWQGLDPQELYTGPLTCRRTGSRSIAAMNAWHDAARRAMAGGCAAGPRRLREQLAAPAEGSGREISARSRLSRR